MCEISEEEIKETIKNYLNDTDFELISFESKPASEKPLGFLGEHVRLIVKITINSIEETLQFFAKKIPTQVQSQRDYAEATKAFYKEIELYKTLFDDMEKAITVKTQWRPECFLTRDWDLLIVEDLSLKNYYMLPERSFMDFDHVKASLKSMARMHSRSIIFEEKLNAGLVQTKSQFSKKGKIKDLYPNLIFESECTDKPGHPGYNFWEAGIKGQTALIDYLPGYSDEQKERIKETFPDTVRQVYRMLEPSTKFRNVMIHADLWGNNLLFRKLKDNSIEAIIVDFQMTRYAPPAQDLFMLLHIVTEREFRNKHETTLISYYYNCLEQELKNENLKIDQLLPYTEFEESCKFYKKYAVLNQMIYTQLNLTPAHLCQQFMATSEMYNKVMYEDRSQILVESFKGNELCKKCVVESMDEIIAMFDLA